MEKNSKILVLGHKGLVGSAIIRELKKQGYENVRIQPKLKWPSMSINQNMYF